MQTSGLQIGEKITLCYFKPSACCNLSPWPQEMNARPQPHPSPVASVTKPPRMETLRPPHAAQSVSQGPEFWPSTGLVPHAVLHVFGDHNDRAPTELFLAAEPLGGAAGAVGSVPHTGHCWLHPLCQDRTGRGNCHLSECSSSAAPCLPNVHAANCDSFGTFNFKQNETYIFLHRSFKRTPRKYV